MIAEAQKIKDLPAFDLVIADEAHRCAGKVSSCDSINNLKQTDDQKADICNSSYQSTTSDGRATQCKWGQHISVLKHTLTWTCNDGGGSCSTW